MKKKQKQKLLNQFRLSFENTRQKLFHTLEKKAADSYDLEITVKLNPKNSQEMLIENLKATDTPVLTVPVDDSFTTIIKRIQKNEAGLLEQFTTNLTQEIANYWYKPAKPAEEIESVAKTSTQEEVVKAKTTAKAEKAATETTDPVAEETTSAVMTYTAFDTAIQAFPKFFTTTEGDAVLVQEKTAKEDRLLAQVSTSEVNRFVIEKALERKYKVKTEVIPLIEALAMTPLAQR